MPNTKTPNEKPQAEKTPGKDDYNPVNMAGKGVKTSEKPLVTTTSGHDDYNPVNMAGRKVEVCKDNGEKDLGDLRQ